MVITPELMLDLRSVRCERPLVVGHTLFHPVTGRLLRRYGMIFCVLCGLMSAMAGDHLLIHFVLRTTRVETLLHESTLK
jgi:hypothetical protein